MVKIYSDKTGKFYESLEAAEIAEQEVIKKEAQALAEREKKNQEIKAKKDKEAAERKAMAAEVEAARKTLTEAQKVYREKLEAFCEKYHTYHTSLSANDVPSLFDWFWF